MKRLLHIFIVIIVATSLWGCGRSRSVAALVEADSLMWTRPDSSLALVQSVSPDTLDDENRAYHALLLTQAQFRNNIYPDTDTIINRALDFYADNYNRERLTRSLIYKGAIYEISQKPAQAIDWYLKAEDNSDRDDYDNLANIHCRIAVVLRNHFASYKEDLLNFQKSLYYYRKIGNVKQQVFCLMNIGGLYREYKADSAFIVLRQAINMAKQIGDTASAIICNEYIARQFLSDSLYRECISTIRTAMSIDDKYRLDDEYLDLAYCYALVGKVDSAEYFYGKVTETPKSSVEDVMRNYTLSKIAEAKGDYKKAYEYLFVVKTLSEELLRNNNNKAIYKQALIHSNNTQTKYKTIIEKNLSQVSVYLIAGLLFILLSSFFIFRSISLRKNNIKLFHDTTLEHERELALIAEGSYLKLMALAKDNELLRQTIDNHILQIRHLVISSYDKRRKDFTNDFNEIVLMTSGSNERFWKDLRNYVDIRNNGIISHINSLDCDINEKEMGIIELLCCGFSSQEIAICMGYEHSGSIRALKTRIKNKLNIDSTLDQFIDNWKNNSRI